jgi:hypothetical protein
MREEPDVRPLHQVALTAALFFAGLPQAPRRSLDVLGRKGKSPGAVHMARWFRWTLPMRNVTTFPVIWAGAREDETKTCVLARTLPLRSTTAGHVVMPLAQRHPSDPRLTRTSQPGTPSECAGSRGADRPRIAIDELSNSQHG